VWENCTCSPRTNAKAVSRKAELTKPEAAVMILNDGDFFALKIGRAEPVGNITLMRPPVVKGQTTPSVTSRKVLGNVVYSWT
jgi:hypothetical protein